MGAVKVFEERITEEVFVGRTPNNCRDRLIARQLRSPPSTFAHNELVPNLGVIRDRLLERTHNYWLKDSDFLDRLREFVKFIFIKYGTRLLLIGNDGANGKFGISRPGNGY